MSGNGMLSAYLKERFASAGVPLRIATRSPMKGRMIYVHPSVMIVDIRPVASPVPPREAVVLWPGEARLEVPAIDARRRQLVLRVEERERVLLVKSRWFPDRWDPVRFAADRRSFLVGMDECHLFMARLPRAAGSVANAHDLLAPAVVREGRRHGTGVPRQGEFFFVPASPIELRAIEGHLQGGETPRPGIVGTRFDSWTRWDVGKPHRATETVFLQGDSRDTLGAVPGGPSRRVRGQFVRGLITHPDHHTLRLRLWARPHLNTEVRRANVWGVTWVD